MAKQVQRVAPAHLECTCGFCGSVIGRLAHVRYGYVTNRGMLCLCDSCCKARPVQRVVRVRTFVRKLR